MTSRRDGLLLSGAFVTFAISAALMHSYSVFLVAFLEEFRWSRAETSLAFSISALVSGASAPFVGALVDRLGPRRLVLLGGSVLTLGLLGGGYVDALWQIVALYGILMTLGANCLGLVVFVPVLSRRFVSNRGMAISIVQSANGFARAVSAPLAQLAISAIGWRHAYLAQAALMGVLIWPLAALFRRDEPPTPAPRTSVLAPGGGVAADRPARRDWTLAEAMATPSLLAPVRGLPVHGPRELLRLAAPARLRRGRRVRQALCRHRARHRRVPFRRRDDRHRNGVGLHRPRALGAPRLRCLDRRRDLRPLHHRAGRWLAALAARLPVRIKLAVSNLLGPETVSTRIRLATEKVEIMLANKKACIIDEALRDHNVISVRSWTTGIGTVAQLAIATLPPRRDFSTRFQCKTKLPACGDCGYAGQPKRLNGFVLISDEIELAKLAGEVRTPVPNCSIISQCHRVVPAGGDRDHVV